MAESNSLHVLMEDIKHTALKLHDAANAAEWSKALTLQRQLLGLCSRSYARLSGIQEALALINDSDTK